MKIYRNLKFILLAILATGATWFYTYKEQGPYSWSIGGDRHMDGFREVSVDHGFPLGFVRASLEYGYKFDAFGFIIDVVFWFIVLRVVFWVMKKIPMNIVIKLRYKITASVRFIKRRKLAVLGFGFAVLILVGISGLGFLFPERAILLKTDKAVYRPGELVQIRARHFSPVRLLEESRKAYTVERLNENSGAWFGVVERGCCSSYDEVEGFMGCPIATLAPPIVHWWWPLTLKTWTWDQQEGGVCKDGYRVSQQVKPGQFRISIFVRNWLTRKGESVYSKTFRIIGDL